MKVSIIGTGYVGLVSGTCFAEMGHEVTCIDIDPKKIEKLKAGKSPIYEPGLDQMLERNIESKRLSFSTNYESVSTAQVTFLAVGTPSTPTGEADLKYLFAATEEVAKFAAENSIVVIKSTVPVGTSLKVREVLNAKTKKKIHVVNNPEFLKEGTAIADFMKPDRVVIGHNDLEAAKAMEDLYEPLVRQGNPIFLMSNLSAETTKYAANCFLAAKISFINEIARLCDVVGADIEEVRKGISSDVRIGKHFLYPGPGYGGSCFPKDVKALVATAKEYNLDLKVVEAAEEVNKEQKIYMFKKMQKHFGGSVKGKKFAFWGAAFKANTDDIRETASIDMAVEIIKDGGQVIFFDPVAGPNYSEHMAKIGYPVQQAEDKYECLNGTDGLVVLTEWPEFKVPNFDDIYKKLNEKVIFDGRNLFSTEKVLSYKFKYYAIGKKIQ